MKQSIHKLIEYSVIILLLICATLGLDFHPVLAGNRALLTGVQNYPNQKKLRGVGEDVQLLEKALINIGMFPKQEIKILLDNQATKSNITETFKSWLIDGSNPGDTVLFYFNGHGIRVWDEEIDKFNDQDSGVVCWDTQILKPKVHRKIHGISQAAYEVADTKSLLIGREFRGLLKQLQGRRVIFISDPVPCFNNDFGTLGVEFAAFVAAKDQPAQVVNFQADPKGFHSVFTWFLIRGLAGAADPDNTGVVTFGKLAEYISSAVKKGGFRQDPQAIFSPKSLGDEPLVKSFPQ